MTSNELKECPFCGSRDVAEYHNNEYTTWVTCRDCECAGPTDNVDYVKLWNNRTVPMQGEVVEDINEAATRIYDWVQAYPKDIFTPPTPEQWKQAHEYFKTQGFSIDRISGEYGRRIISSIQPQIETIMRLLPSLSSLPQPVALSEDEAVEIMQQGYQSEFMKPQGMHEDGMYGAFRALLKHAHIQKR